MQTLLTAAIAIGAFLYFGSYGALALRAAANCSPLGYHDSGVSVALEPYCAVTVDNTRRRIPLNRASEKRPGEIDG